MDTGSSEWFDKSSENSNAYLDGGYEERALSRQSRSCDAEVKVAKFSLLEYSISWYEHVWEADAIEESTTKDPNRQRPTAQQAEIEVSKP